MKNFLITQGCTGTYSIIDVLGGRFNNPQINHHCRDSNSNIFVKNSRVVYLLCNPYDYTISSFTRSKEGPFNISHTRQCDGDWEYFEDRKDQTLEEYLLNNTDRRYNLLFMRYEALGEYGVKPLVDFWGLDADPSTYKFKQRKSDWTQMSDEVKLLLENKYGKVMEWYENLPLVQKFGV
jgi:hypothetical protein